MEARGTRRVKREEKRRDRNERTLEDMAKPKSRRWCFQVLSEQAKLLDGELSFIHSCIESARLTRLGGKSSKSWEGTRRRRRARLLRPSFFDQDDRQDYSRIVVAKTFLVAAALSNPPSALVLRTARPKARVLHQLLLSCSSRQVPPVELTTKPATNSFR